MLLNGFSFSRQWQVLPMIAACLLALTACNSSSTSTESQAATSPTRSGAAGNSFEVVLVDRPTPADGELKLARESAYKLCVAGAELMHMPVKPFPKIPDDYITQRTTYISDGSSWMRKTEPVYRTDLDDMVAEKGCEAKIVPDKSFEVTIEHAGKQINLSGHDDGTTSVESADDELGAINAEAKPKTYDDYTDHRTVAGVNLRCLPKTSPLISPTGLIDMCVYEKDGAVTTSDKKSIVLYSNVDPLNSPLAPYTVITEVRSLKLGTAIDPRVFNAETYSK